MNGHDRRPFTWAFAVAVAIFIPGFTLAIVPGVGLDDPVLVERARSLAIGERLRIEDLRLDVSRPPEALEVERFRVFAPGARVVIHDGQAVATLPPPSNIYLRGTVASRPGARAVLTVLEDGGLRGLVVEGGRFWLLVRGPRDARLQVEEVTEHPALAVAGRQWACGTDSLPPAPHAATLAAKAESGSRGERPLQAAGHTVLVAVESDYEYYQIFGSIAAALSYAADLFAYASTYFTSEVGADFWLQHVSLWTTPADPWTQTSSGCCLFEFSRYWNTNMSGLQRSVAHFLSGKTAGGGMAWPGAMCAGSFPYDITGWGCSLTPAVDLYGGDYSFSGDLAGSFSISNPSVVWDIYVVSHEVGHHFNTPHTHCYSPPIDQCWGTEPGCYSGPPSLPCPTPGAGCGTIMSYCHTLTPGMPNISLTFGQGHPWGNAPGRVPALMSAYLASTAAAYPRCLAPIVFADSFEAGDASAWSSTTP